MVDFKELLAGALVALTIANLMVLLATWWINHEGTYLCKGCSDEEYRDLVTVCHAVREFAIKAGGSLSFNPDDYKFFNVSCIPPRWELVWLNITSEKPVKVAIGSKTFQGTNIMYGCNGCNGVRNVTITALQDTRVIVEVRSISPCIFDNPHTDLYRLYEALPNLHADQDCP